MDPDNENSTCLTALQRQPGRVADLDPEEVAALLSRVERLRARLWHRLTRPSKPEPSLPSAPSPNGDQLLDADAVAEILDVDTRYIYDHADDWPFTRRLSPRKLRFSERGLYRWLETRQ